MKESDKAKDNYLDALEIFVSNFGENHVDVAGVKYHLASLSLKKNKREKAFDYLTECLKIRKQLLGNEHPDVKKVQAELNILCESTPELKEKMA
eukprot:CAMPEP_0114581232 /NCGR_PEP_ID=MMETSP0125-20121206/5378_1 /TAXON_ID=485358 ORGANISM="Aristerostoma sp., Strain ATCC 50986" /NCGR_SAMPLE_ID=MMETSP0125 /ASSEMBLY_ACC=CAM_ASM_000245 /LENGTH=93 /DNA_ID=CAMNT_0001773309 /DNA_START=1001 /DNA_END=1282 /DNA_ORIENTATION=-